MSEFGIYERVRLMSVSMARVVDPRTVPGRIRLDLDLLGWHEDGDHRESGYLRLALADPSTTQAFRDNVFVAVTRFVVDCGIDVNDCLDEAFHEARLLPGWTEQQADRYPISGLNDGSTIQAGSFVDDNVGWLFTVTKYVLYQRSNVVYLVQCTGTTASEQAAELSSLIRTVKSAHLED